ncbi:Glycogen synthase [Serratia proteamaculans]|uniref:glycosyltransferase family 4 protein n=1 Tax=Serratia proteamaculans TaxID=28151 RepID=UPI0021784543|nr:glycosyltransferase family 1 protein [Serratia proteamaculans]CAI0779943.1 Glycogen synthase [Serratia proteamaculans]CAI1569171.1 Glycogen synthase [Serratia proteamaculans]
MLYVNARFLTQEVTGVQRFAEMISLELSGLKKDICFLCPPGILRVSVAERLGVHIIGRYSGHFWEQIELPRFLKNKNNPLLLNLGSTGPVFYKNKIVTHHDVSYLRYPESYSKSFVLFYKIIIPLMVRRSRHLITVSEFSKNEISLAYNTALDKISVVYNAASVMFEPRCNFSHNKNNDNYLLAVSSPNFHKNFHGMLSAFMGAMDKSKPSFSVKLKIIGASSSVFSKTIYKKTMYSNDIEFIGRVNDEELVELYQNALAFIFPSFYEGFGIPPLEAQASGCPVVSSNRAAMPEVLGDSVLYFDPNDDEGFSNAIVNIIENRDLRNSLINRGFENVGRFSWESSARKIIELVNEIEVSS